MHLGFLLVNGSVGTLGSYLVFRKHRHLGLLAAGACMVVASVVTMSGEDWMMLLGISALGVVLFKAIGNPLDA